jgi:hypothetical protein
MKKRNNEALEAMKAWLRVYEQARVSLSIPLAFLHGVSVMNKWPHNSELGALLGESIHAIENASKALGNAHHREQEHWNRGTQSCKS